MRSTERPLQDGIYEVLMIGAAAFVLARAWVDRENRLGWALIGGSLALSALGDLYYIVAFDSGPIPFPSAADAIYFASYPVAIAGLLLLSGRRGERGGMTSALAVTILGMATLWSWLVFSQVVEMTRGSTEEVAVTLAYPLLDFILLAFVVVVLAGRGWKLDAPFFVLLAGFSMIALADVIYAYEQAKGTYQEWTILDTMWPIGAVMIATGAWMRSSARARSLDFRQLSFGLTSASIALAVFVLIWDHFQPFDHLTVILAGITLCVAIVELYLLNRARTAAETQVVVAAAENEALAMIVRSSEDAIIGGDLEGRVTSWNEGAEKIYGYTAEEAIGRPVTELIVPEGQEEEVTRLLETVSAGQRAAYETRRRTKNGRLVDVSLRAFPLRDGSGRVMGVSVSAHDITERRIREEQETRDREGRLWRGRITSALANDEMAFWGQPVVDATTGHVDHYELLIRMMLDDEPVAPNLFIPHAESSDLIHEIDHWAVRRGIEFARHVPVAINLSARSLGDRHLVDLIRNALRTASVPAENLTLELTETAAAENLEGAVHMVSELRSLGCPVALDDFGTGFNSFTYLKHLDVSALKIDMQFVRRLIDEPANERIVSSIVSIARNFGMTTVAEGVEDEATLILLRRLGVDAVQGYYVGYPARMTTNPQRPKPAPTEAVPAADASAAAPDLKIVR